MRRTKRKSGIKINYKPKPICTACRRPSKRASTAKSSQLAAAGCTRVKTCMQGLRPGLGYKLVNGLRPLRPFATFITIYSELIKSRDETCRVKTDRFKTRTFQASLDFETYKLFKKIIHSIFFLGNGIKSPAGL